MISARRADVLPTPGSSARARLVDLDAVVAFAQTLEPLPASVARLAVLVADENADLREIVEVIAYDQALTGNLLRRANSAASAGRNPIRTVHEAVIRLGTGTVLALAMSASVAKRMGPALPEYGLGEGELWNHSVLAALGAELIRRDASVAVPPEVVTAALLHDLGKLVLARFLGPEITGLLRAGQEVDQLTLAEAERAVLEVDHGELGAVVAQHWRLPNGIVNGIMHHHDPSGTDLPICFATFLADQAAMLVHERMPWSESSRVPAATAAQAEALDELGIEADQWPAMCATLAALFGELRERYV